MSSWDAVIPIRALHRDGDIYVDAGDLLLGLEAIRHALEEDGKTTEAAVVAAVAATLEDVLQTPDQPI